MAANDLFLLTLVGRFQGQDVVNTFTFRARAVVPAPTQDAENLVSRFEAELLPKIAAVSVNQLVYTQIRAQNLFTDADGFSKSISVPGSISQFDLDHMPAFVAYAFRLGTAGSSVADGSKRFAGVPETSANDGVLTDAGTLGLLDQLAEALEKALTDGALIPTDIWLPVVVKRVRGGVQGSYTYRLPRNAQEAVFALIVNVAYQILLSSQVSRKIGVGV